MKIALDPYMFRDCPARAAGVVAESATTRSSSRPGPTSSPSSCIRARTKRVREFRAALDDTACEIASVLPLYRWSGPDEDERQAAVRYWKRAIQISVDLGVTR